MLVTLKDIAREFGVAPSTVSNALNGRSKGSYPRAAARAERIRRYAESHGYRPSAAARAVRSQRTFQVGVLLPNRPNHAYTHPCAFDGILGLNCGMQEAGFIVSIIRFDDLTRDVATHTRLFSERSLDGLVVFGHFPEWAPDELRRLVARIVWMDTGVWEDCACLRRDEAHAGRTAAAQVAAQGYRRLVWLGYQDAPQFHHYSHEDRRRAALAAAAQAGLAVEEVAMRPWPGMDDWQGLEDRLTPDTAVLAETVYHAQMLAHRVAARGLTAPRDFGLACCDDSQEVQRLWPDLSRVSFDRFEMGRQAGEMLRLLIDTGAEAVPSRLLCGDWVAGSTASRRTPLPHPFPSPPTRRTPR